MTAIWFNLLAQGRLSDENVRGPCAGCEGHYFGGRAINTRAAIIRPSMSPPWMAPSRRRRSAAARGARTAARPCTTGPYANAVAGEGACERLIARRRVLRWKRLRIDSAQARRRGTIPPTRSKAQGYRKAARVNPSLRAGVFPYGCDPGRAHADLCLGGLSVSDRHRNPAPKKVQFSSMRPSANKLAETMKCAHPGISEKGKALGR